MLKPKKKITKKEIKQDPFLEKVDKAEAYFENNKQRIVQVLAFGLILFFGFQYISNSNNEKEMESNAKLSQALVAVEKGDSDNATVQLESIIQKYAGKTASDISHYYLGKMFFDQKQFEDSKTHLNKFIKSDAVPALIPSSYKMLGSIAHSQNNVEKAIALYQNGISNSTIQYQNHELSIALAKLQLINGNIEKARLIAENLQTLDAIDEKLKNSALEIIHQTNG